MASEYQYNAFISYRHCELDQFVAATIHKELEAFHVPKRLGKKYHYTRTKIDRVFRDKEELPLTDNLDDPIMAAIRGSEYLIVICTPRIKESVWCEKEIETFIKLHGREKVLAVLAEAEPADSYPDVLLHREKQVTREDGTVETILEDIEPLGADVRGKTKKEIKKAIKDELPRLVAPMFGTSFDGLRQRHREQKMKKVMSISIAVSSVFLIFGAISTSMALKISKQNAELLYNQAIQMSEESERLLENGDRMTAISTAREALESVDGGDMPYTAEAEYALSDALRVYENGDTLLPDYQVKTAAAVRDIVYSVDWTYYASLDDIGQIMIRKVEDGEVVAVIDDAAKMDKRKLRFLTDTELVYIADTGRVFLYNIEDGSTTQILSDTSHYFINMDGDRNFVIAGGSDFLEVYRADDLSLVYEESYDGDYDATNEGEFYVDGDTEYFAFRMMNIADLDNSEYQMALMNLSTGEISYHEMGNYSISAFTFRDGKLYIYGMFYEDLMSKPQSKMDAVDVATGEFLWSVEYDDIYGAELKATDGDEPALVLIGSTGITILDAETGEKRADMDMGSTIIGNYTVIDSNLITIFTRTGGRIVLDTADETAYESTSAYTAHSDRLSDCYVGNGGIIFTESNKNTITRYVYFKNDFEAYEDEIEEIETETITYSEAREMATENGYEDPNLVSEIYTNPDGSLTFVFYSNYRVAIYDSKTNELLNLIEDTNYTIDVYFGEDKEGNYYIGNSFAGAYKINKENQVVAYIEHLKKINTEDNTFVLGDRSYYICPNYSLEELCEMADYSLPSQQ